MQERMAILNKLKYVIFTWIVKAMRELMSNNWSNSTKVNNPDSDEKKYQRRLQFKNTWTGYFILYYMFITRTKPTRIQF